MSLWITNETRSLLKIPLNSEQDELVHDYTPLIEKTNPQNKVEYYRWEYIRLCAKLNKEELEDQRYDEMVLREANQKKSMERPKTKCDESDYPCAGDSVQLSEFDLEKVNSFFNGKFYSKQSPDTKENGIDKQKADKKVRFQEEPPLPDENEDDQPSEKEKEEEEALFMPVNECLQPNSKRRQVFLREVRTFIEEIFDSELEIIEIAAILDEIKAVVATFYLTPQNMTLGRKRNLVVSILLLRLILLYNLIDSTKYDHLFRSNVIIGKVMHKFSLTTEQIDESLTRIIQRK